MLLRYLPIADNPPVAIAVVIILFWAWAVGTCRPKALGKRRSVRFWTVAALFLGPAAVLMLNVLPAVPTARAGEDGPADDPVT